MSEQVKKKRIWELDFLRGIALILMVYFHAIYDMKEFFNYPIRYDAGINFYIGKVSVMLFIIISGISCSLSRSNVRRGFRLLGVALLVSLFSYFYNPVFIIKFGIIHFFAVSMIIYPLVNRLNNLFLLILGTVIILLGQLTSRIHVSYDYLFPFGVTSPGFISSDYYSLIPWLGLFLYGILLGRTLYREKTSLFPFIPKDNIISFSGRHTLLIYILHQPVIIGAISLIKIMLK